MHASTLPTPPVQCSAFFKQTFQTLSEMKFVPASDIIFLGNLYSSNLHCSMQGGYQQIVSLPALLFGIWWSNLQYKGNPFYKYWMSLLLLPPRLTSSSCGIVFGLCLLKFKTHGIVCDHVFYVCIHVTPIYRILCKESCFLNAFVAV